jgi:imidazole glycerol-phosphate synthase subunit HisH
MKDVVVLDYGSGNLRSAQRALEAAGAQVQVTASAELAATADGLVVPGVGAFESCARGLHSVGGARLIERRLAGGRPVLGTGESWLCPVAWPGGEAAGGDPAAHGMEHR